MSAVTPGGTPRSRARRFGRCLKWQTTETGLRELRIDKLGRLTLITITPASGNEPGRYEYSGNLRPSEAAIATMGWHK